ncbi:hypothetical protein C8A05DRAFT_20590, partial [Staphylotrichum tortipilum]
LRSLNRAFGFIMANRSGRYRIVPDASDSDAGADGDSEEEECPEYLREVVEEYGIQYPEVKTNSEVVAELQHLASLNQGLEFPGEANSDLARQLFKDQATPWHDIAWRHIELTLAASQEFAEGAFYHITGVDDSTSGAIVNDCVEPFFEAKREKLRDKLEELLHPYANGCGIPPEDEFRKIMRGIRLRRLARQIQERLENRPEGTQRLDIENMLRDLDVAEVDSFGSAKVLEMMEAFYDASLSTFTDNVINLAVERCLVYPLPALFTSENVHQMTVEKLEELAAESPDVRTQRDDLEKEIRILKEGLRRCQRHRPHLRGRLSYSDRSFFAILTLPHQRLSP